MAGQMNAYEALFLINAGLNEKAAAAVFDQIKGMITKNEGSIISSRIWAEKRKLSYPIKKNQEATYYFMSFNLNPLLIDKIRQACRLNENILRVLITEGIPPEAGKK